MRNRYTVELKRGSNLSLGGTVSLPSGTWTAKSSVKSTNPVLLIEPLTVTLTPPAGIETNHTILIEATAANTSDWPYGKLECDIRYSDSTGYVIHSPTFYIDVVKEITYASD